MCLNSALRKRLKRLALFERTYNNNQRQSASYDITQLYTNVSLLMFIFHYELIPYNKVASFLCFDEAITEKWCDIYLVVNYITVVNETSLEVDFSLK